MPTEHRQPQMWTIGSGASVLATVAIAGLFAAFFVISLIRHFGLQALAFSGLGALAMIAMAAMQWRIMKRRDGGQKL